MRKQHLIAQPQWQPSCQAHWFSAKFWQQANAIRGEAKGRHTTYFVEHEQEQWVLRHYYRGGFVSRWLHDQYLYYGRAHSRSFAEYELLEWMHQQGLPVPRPIAALCAQQGLIYRADILIERLPDCQDLLAWLQHSPLSASEWRSLGATLARFHLAGVNHADLNIKNILWNGTSAFLIDFDRGRVQAKPGSWQQSNLKRLRRSFLKEGTKQSSLHWTPDDFAELLAGYQAKLSQG